MVHVLLSMDKPVGSAGETLQVAPVTLVMLPEPPPEPPLEPPPEPPLEPLPEPLPEPPPEPLPEPLLTPVLLSKSYPVTHGESR